MVIVPPPKQAWKREAILLFKKGGVLQHICVCEIISIKFVGERGREIETDKQRNRERKFRPNQQTCFGLPAARTPAHAAFALTWQSAQPGLHQNGKGPQRNERRKPIYEDVS